MKHMKANVPRNCCMRYGALGLALLLAGPAMAYKGEKLAKDATVSIAKARAIALKAHPGKITDEELERERGGTGLRYSFDIKSGGATQEVGVDARTGRVLENAKEGEKSRLRVDRTQIGSARFKGSRRSDTWTTQRIAA